MPLVTDRLRVAHCADIHLGGDLYGQESDIYRHGFSAVLGDIRAHSPGLMLLAGDLFDTNRAGAETIAWAMATLAALPFPVVMIPGNHDCMEPGGIYTRHDFSRIPNVTLLSAPEGELAQFPELGVVVWGKGMVEHCSAYRPLAGCPDRPPGCRWYLGLGHGLFVHEGEGAGRSSPIHLREIEACPCDYLALGHHHAAMELVTDRATAAYSGSPTDTLGRGATYVIVDLAVGNTPAVRVHTLPATAAAG